MPTTPYLTPGQQEELTREMMARPGESRKPQSEVDILDRMARISLDHRLSLGHPPTAEEAKTAWDFADAWIAERRKRQREAK